MRRTSRYVFIRILLDPNYATLPVILYSCECDIQQPCTPPGVKYPQYPLPHFSSEDTPLVGSPPRDVATHLLQTPRCTDHQKVFLKNQAEILKFI